MSEFSDIQSRLAVKVCKLFYQEQLSKTDIEKRLHVSRFKVARIIRHAIESGLVRIEIFEPDADLSGLESRLESALGLRAVVLVPDFGESPEHLKAKVGRVAASYLLEVLGDGNILGVGWGTTTAQLVNALPDAIQRHVGVVQLSGGDTLLEGGIDSQALTIRLAGKFGVAPHILHAPAILDRAETRELLMRESGFREIFDYYRKLDVLIAGIGAFLPEGFRGSRVLDASEFETLRRQRAVGEFLYYCFDIEGRLCETEHLGRIMAIPLEYIRRVPCTIGIAAGREKARAVLGAVRAGLINTLITDAATARALLEDIGADQTKRREK